MKCNYCVESSCSYCSFDAQPCRCRTSGNLVFSRLSKEDVRTNSGGRCCQNDVRNVLTDSWQSWLAHVSQLASKNKFSHHFCTASAHRLTPLGTVTHCCLMHRSPSEQCALLHVLLTTTIRISPSTSFTICSSAANKSATTTLLLWCQIRCSEWNLRAALMTCHLATFAAWRQYALALSRVR